MLTSLASQCHGPLLLFHKFHFSEIMRNYLDNITYLSQYSKQDENPIRDQSLTLLRFKCQAPAQLCGVFLCANMLCGVYLIVQGCTVKGDDDDYPEVSCK